METILKKIRKAKKELDKKLQIFYFGAINRFIRGKHEKSNIYLMACIDIILNKQL